MTLRILVISRFSSAQPKKMHETSTLKRRLIISFWRQPAEY